MNKKTICPTCGEDFELFHFPVSDERGHIAVIRCGKCGQAPEGPLGREFRSPEEFAVALEEVADMEDIGVSAN
jgi:uncharacterized Zn finger protein